MLMAFVISIVTGALIGYIASARSPTDGLEDLTRNIIVGTTGAFAGVYVFGRMVDSPEAGASALALGVASIAGAAVALYIVKRVRTA